MIGLKTGTLHTYALEVQYSIMIKITVSEIKTKTGRNNESNTKGD